LQLSQTCHASLEPRHVLLLLLLWCSCGRAAGCSLLLHVLLLHALRNLLDL
jgi:hypothetical protein